MRKKHKFVIVFLMILAVATACLLAANQRKTQPTINRFEDCSKAGYPVRESYPAVCSTPDGRSFTQPINSDANQ